MIFNMPVSISKYLFLLISITVFSCQAAIAQTPDTSSTVFHSVRTAGLKAGFNVANISNLAVSDVYLGWHAGIFGNVQASEGFGYGTEINYSKQGVSVNNFDISLNYVSVPVFLNLYTGPVIFQAGGYGAFLFSASGDGGQARKELTQFFQDTDYGLLVGFVLKPGSRTFLAGRFNLGFNNINDHFTDPPSADIRNRNIQLSLGYDF
jgi:hypothetical protein